MICAAEDVGNADPQALQVAVAAAQAVERHGMPDARIPLAQAVTDVASAPKSNAAYLAVDAALEAVRNTKTTVPVHLQDSHFKGAGKLGHGTGYQYAHDYPNLYVEQQYLRNTKTTVPVHLQDSHYKGAGKLGHGTGYQYAHDYPNHYVEQQYLPTELKEKVFYQPTDNGYEKKIQEYFQKIHGTKEQEV